MHAGCPVLCSGTTALPEIAGKAAMYFDPLDVDDIACKLLHILDSPIKRKKLIAEGKENAARFSGSKLARETIAVYEKFK
jgi:glycosyltransferase involved in cell wall biosynthesis